MMSMLSDLMMLLMNTWNKNKPLFPFDQVIPSRLAEPMFTSTTINLNNNY